MKEIKTSRRNFLVGGAASIGAGAGFAAGSLFGAEQDAAPAPDGNERPRTVPFYGSHQAGIVEPPPTQAAFIAFDLSAGADRGKVVDVMKGWTALGKALALGQTDVDGSLVSHGSKAGLFTMTVGISGTGLDRLGLPRPAALVDHPVFVGDQLDEAISFGDVFVQFCSNDAVYLGGAIRSVRRVAPAALKPRWHFNGFRGVDAAISATNGRNLMGQIDGTNNIAASRAAEGGPVWVEKTGPAWLAGGSYVAIRRFRMLLNAWETAGRTIQDRTVGRHLDTGAPIGSSSETDPVDLDAVDGTGAPLIPVNAHIRLAAPRLGAGEEMLRRSYSYSAGQTGIALDDEDAGLIFVSYQSDPTTSFIPVQQRLAESDALNRFTVATSSALFALLPGVVDAEDWYGRALFA
jgi:deferrochelatase/peroxidase EfeB